MICKSANTTRIPSFDHLHAPQGNSLDLCLCNMILKHAEPSFTTPSELRSSFTSFDKWMNCVSTFTTSLVLTFISYFLFVVLSMESAAKVTKPQWETALTQLPKPSKEGRIPAFFFAHGSPLLIWPENMPVDFPEGMAAAAGPKGQNAQFLRFFGPFLLERYKPKAIVVFSAHWETQGQIEVMSYEKNHILYDYYGFPEELYKLTFECKGSSEIAKRVAELLNKNNISAKTITKGRGLDHGVFVPFRLMFPQPFDIPVVEVSMDSSLDPQKLIDIGKALIPLRDEGVLILSGGLTIHTFREFNAFDPKSAPDGFKDFEKQVIAAVENSKTPEERNSALKAVTKHPFFRRAHPREDHFVPLYIAAGAGSDGDAVVVGKVHGAISIAFGL